MKLTLSHFWSQPLYQHFHFHCMLHCDFPPLRTTAIPSWTSLCNSLWWYCGFIMTARQIQPASCMPSVATAAIATAPLLHHKFVTLALINNLLTTMAIQIVNVTQIMGCGHARLGVVVGFEFPAVLQVCRPSTKSGSVGSLLDEVGGIFLEILLEI